MFELLVSIGAVLFLGGGGLAFLTLAASGALRFGQRGLENLAALFRRPLALLGLGGGLVSAGLGMMLILGGVYLSDQGRHDECRARCTAAGYTDGVVRGSPHVPFRQGDPVGCWCKDARGFAPEPLP